MVSMSDAAWITLKGRPKKGCRVASGPSKAYPDYGSIEKQKPYFRKLGLNLSRAFNGREYRGWVYYPHPETKKDHFQSRSTVEVLAPYIEGIKYGNVVEITLDQAEIKISKP